MKKNHSPLTGTNFYEWETIDIIAIMIAIFGIIGVLHLFGIL